MISCHLRHPEEGYARVRFASHEHAERVISNGRISAEPEAFYSKGMHTVPTPRTRSMLIKIVYRIL